MPEISSFDCAIRIVCEENLNPSSTYCVTIHCSTSILLPLQISDTADNVDTAESAGSRSRKEAEIRASHIPWVMHITVMLQMLKIETPKYTDYQLH